MTNSTFKSSRATVLLGYGVEVVVDMFGRYLRSTLQRIDHLQAGISTEMEPHITLQHVFVGGKLTQTDRFLASHRLEGTLVLIEMMVRLLQTT